MADNKKLSVAEMLAAARKADAGSVAPAASSGEAPASELPSMDVPADAPAVESSAPPAKPKPAVGVGGGRPSVAEVLAMARSGDAAPPAPKKPAEKPAPKAAPAAKSTAPKAAAAPAPPPQRDTGSVLVGDKKKDKPGPMSKAEAAAMPAAAPRPPVEPKIIVPPMPAKPDYAKPKGAVPKPAKAAGDEDRRSFLSIGFWLLGAVSALWTLLTVKFMFPNVLREPPSKFKVGFPDAFPAGQVSEKFKAQFGVWIVNTEYNGQPEIVALKTVCTHLGCTPNWLEAEQKYKCPCHGSGFYKDGINFEGPAPRPLERYAIRVADDGQIEVDKSRIFQEEMGQWADASSFIPV